MVMIRRLGSVLLTALLLTGSIWGQPDSSPPPEGCPPICVQRMPRGFEANYENLRLFKLLEAVDLSEEQSQRFIPMFHGYRKDIRQLRQERADLIDQLKGTLDRKDADDQIRALLRQLDDNQATQQRREKKFSDVCDGVLAVPPKAKLAIFEERFEREVLECMREFRGQGGPGPGKNR